LLLGQRGVTGCSVAEETTDPIDTANSSAVAGEAKGLEELTFG